MDIKTFYYPLLHIALHRIEYIFILIMLKIGST